MLCVFIFILNMLKFYIGICSYNPDAHVCTINMEIGCSSLKTEYACMLRNYRCYWNNTAVCCKYTYMCECAWLCVNICVLTQSTRACLETLVVIVTLQLYVCVHVWICASVYVNMCIFIVEYIYMSVYLKNIIIFVC